MKNVTVTYTLEITEVFRGVEDEAAEDLAKRINQKDFIEAFTKDLKNEIGVNDVVVSNLKMFTMDAPEQEAPEQEQDTEPEAPQV